MSDTLTGAASAAPSLPRALALPSADLTSAERLLAEGFHLVELNHLSKAPKGKAWTDPAQAAQAINPNATGYGMPLASNGFCSLDIDNWPALEDALIGGVWGWTRKAFAELELAGYRITSTRPGSGGRIMFRVPPGLQLQRVTFQTRRQGTVLELRAGAMQDTLPGCRFQGKDGTVHAVLADPGKALAQAPELPTWLAAWWQELNRSGEARRAAQLQLAQALGDELPPAMPGQGGLGQLPFPSSWRAAYEEQHTTESVLERHGYVSDGQGRYWPPSSHRSGAAGVRPVPDRPGLWATSHTSDLLFADDGQDSTLFAAWDAHVMLDHQGDLTAAEAAELAAMRERARQASATAVTPPPIPAPPGDVLFPGWEPPPLPDPIGPAALHGLPGEFVELVKDKTEADPSNVLASFLLLAGAADPFRRISPLASGQPLNLYVAIVGRTGIGRKGTGWALVRDLFRHALPTFAPDRVQTSLSSGEALVWAVRDARRRPAKKGEEALADDSGMVLADPGSLDKRLACQLSEMEGLFAVLDRESNTLSARLREAWDGQPLQVNVRDGGRGAYGCKAPHIAALGHVTPASLRRALKGDRLRENGFANRWLYVLAERTRIDPEPHIWTPADSAWRDIGERLAAAIMLEPATPRLSVTPEARAAYNAWYVAHQDRMRSEPDSIAIFLPRQPANLARLAGIYAMLDSTAEITLAHLEAALAVVEHSEACARWLFQGPPELSADAKKLRTILHRKSGGITRDDLYRNELHRNWPRDRIDSALDELRKADLLREDRRETGGRPMTVLRSL